MNSALREILEDAVARRIFPGATVFLARGENVFADTAFGITAYDAEYSHPVTPRTLYDLASLTKLFTATAFLIAAREGRVGVGTLLAEFFPEFRSEEKSAITLRHLLQHTSGVEIAIQDLIKISPREWITKIAAAPLRSLPGARVLYSCTNFFLLARVIEKLSDIPLDEFITTRVLQPLGMKRTTFYPLKYYFTDDIAPTEIIDGEALHGLVHDEAARAWQEYSGSASCGNAGLFGTAHDLKLFCDLWCNKSDNHEQKILRDEEIEIALSDTALEDNSSVRRGWGWQIDAAFYTSAKAPENSFGHAGFTGPTLWCNRNTRDVCIILNNRVYPTRHGPERFPVHRKIARLLMEF